MNEEINIWDVMDAAMETAKRREAVCKNAPCCPQCGTNQVQLIDMEPVEWRCRGCRFQFRGENDQ